MRVNVSYSVDLDEVLREVQELYLREKNKLEEKLELVEHSLMQNYTDKNLSEIILAVEEYRKVIVNFDLKLAEISNILSGYTSIKERIKNPPRQQETSVGEQN
jgi:hypothetical protein